MASFGVENINMLEAIKNARKRFEAKKMDLNLKWNQKTKHEQTKWCEEWQKKIVTLTNQRDEEASIEWQQSSVEWKPLKNEAVQETH